MSKKSAPVPPAPEYGTKEYADWYAQNYAPKKKRHLVRWTFLTFVGVIAIVVIATSVGGSGDGSDNHKPAGTHKPTKQTAVDQSANDDALHNVTITSCVVDSTTNWPAAKLSIHNPTSKPSDYFITVAFESKDGKTQLGTGDAAVQSVGSGQTALTTAQGLDTINQPITCRVTNAQRIAS